MARTKQTARKGKAPPLYQQIQQQLQESQPGPLFDEDGVNEEEYESDDEMNDFANYWETEEPFGGFEDNLFPRHSRLVVDWSSVTKSTNKLSLNQVKKPKSEFLTASQLNFTGLQSATDYLFYELGKLLQERQNNSNLELETLQNESNKISFNGCVNISIWALHHFYKGFNKSIYDLDESSDTDVLTLQKRVAGCDLIGETLCLALAKELTETFKNNASEVLKNLKDKSKVLIMNETNEKLFLLNSLKSSNSGSENKIFQHEKIEVTNTRELNLIEFSKVKEEFSHIFLTEPNLIVIPFDMEKPEESITNSVFDRLLQAISQMAIVSNVLIVGVGKANSDKMEKLRKSILDKIQNQQKTLEKLIEDYQKKTINAELSFEAQVYLGQIINLSEQFNLIEKLLRYHVVNFELKATNTNETKRILSAGTASQQNSNLIIAWEDVFVSYNATEITSLKYPPTSVNLVGEAFCLLFSKKPSFSTFKQMIGESDFLHKYIRPFDPSTLSDYTMNELTSYIQNPNFAQAHLVSKTAGALSKWIIVVYETARFSRPKDFESLGALDKDAFIDRLAAYSLTCYSCVHFYKDVLESNQNSFKLNEFNSVNHAIQQYDFKKHKFLTYTEYMSLCRKLFLIENERIDNGDFFLFPEKFLKSQCAQGNFLLIGSELLITDFDWFAELINLILSGKDASLGMSRDKKIRKTVGKTAPIWSIQQLSDHLKAHLSKEKFKEFFDHMTFANLFVETKEGFLFVPDLLNDLKNTPIDIYWPKNWSGIEYGVKVNFLNMLPRSYFNQIMKKFFSLNKTKIAWNNGLLNHECGCDIMVTYESNKLTLKLRILDLKKSLNIDPNLASDIAKSVFMEYYLYLQSVFVKSKVAYKIEFKENFKHPCVDKEPRDLDEIMLLEIHRKYLSKLLKHKHKFAVQKPKSDWCPRCNTNLNDIGEAIVLIDLIESKLDQNEPNEGSQIKLPPEFYSMFLKFRPRIHFGLIKENKCSRCNMNGSDIGELYELMDLIESKTKNAEENPHGDKALLKRTRNYFSELTKQINEFKMQISKSELCPQCYMNIDDLHELIGVFESVHKDFRFNHFNKKFEQSAQKQIKRSLVEIDTLRSQTIKAKHSFNREHFRKFTCRFIDTDYKNCVVNVVLDLFKGMTTVVVDLNRRTYSLYYTQKDFSSTEIVSQIRTVQVKRTSLIQSNSSENKNINVCPINSGDQITVELYDFAEESVCARLWYNMEEIADFLLITDGNRLEIKPEIKIESVSSNSSRKKAFILLSSDSITLDSVGDYFARSEECSSQLFPKCRESEVVRFVKENTHMIAKKLRINLDSLEQGDRGITLFPSSSTNFVDEKTLNFLHSNYDFHMFCLNREEFHAIQKNFLHCHLIDVKGLPTNKVHLDMYSILFIALCSYMISTAENSTIVPNCEKLFDNYKPTEADPHNKNLDKKLRKYFMRLFRDLIIYFELEDLKGKNNGSIKLEIKDFVKELSPEDSNKEEYTFVGQCAYCLKSTYSYFHRIQIDEKLNNPYSICSTMFGHRSEYGDTDDQRKLKIDESFVEKFKEIKYFGVSRIKLTISDPKSLFLKFKCLKIVQLMDCDLEKIPESLIENDQLNALIMQHNPIQSFPNQLNKMKSLKTLEINDLSISQSSLFKNNKVINQADLYKLPKGLEKLHLKFMAFNFLPFDLSDCVSSLAELDFEGVRWPNINEYGGINASMTHEQISRLYRHQFSQTELEKLLKYFDSAPGAVQGVIQQKIILKLNAFIFKHFPRLSSSGNVPSGVPNIIFDLRNLTQLNLSYQAIKFIPDSIGKLKNLKILYLDGCILLESISPKIGNLPIEKLNLDHCFSLKTPPPEIVRRGFASVMSYLKRLTTGSVTCKRTKLMLVGLGEAGKTSLVKALVEKSNLMSRPLITDGIEIRDWNIKQPDKTDLTFSIWDFAGQSVYYNSHQFFLCSRAVYFLVWNVRLGSEYAGLDFWLSSISCHAPGAPIFIIGTHIDEVSKYSINQNKLKSRYQQIVGFHFVSNKTNVGIDELVKTLQSVTLQEKYMGEAIPEVWLNFEKEIKSQTQALMTYDELKSKAVACGIHDDQEILQAVRFLSDLGSLQYFETNGLKDRVVINPQWIVNVISCLVSVKETPIVDGRLYHKDIGEIWKNYDSSLHEWLLKLTEEFDLTYRLGDQQVSIVPCMLPDVEVNTDWSDLNNENFSTKTNVKEFHVLYSFAYLPAGLFNRIQVRLFQYADASSLWKSGSLLKKSNHKALISTDIEAGTIEVRVQGLKPENIVFLIHEVIETLINESFNGIHYDFSFSCPDCVDYQSSKPAMFSSSLLRRAHELKAPFLQCSERFHAISIQDMLDIMPLDGLSNLDSNLERSIRDLKLMRRGLKHDLFVWYCAADVPSKKDDPKNEQILCDPTALIDAIKAEGYQVWSSAKPADEKMDQVTLALKESRMVLLCISDQFASDQKCMQVFELVKNIIKKNYLLVEFGKNGSHKWIENIELASIASDFRIIMQDPKRFATKLTETLDSVERYLSEVKVEKSLIQKKPDVFISYCWANSHEAVKKGTKSTATSLGWLDPRSLVKLFEENHINAWIDVTEVGSASSSSSGSLFSDITKGMNQVDVVIACFSDEYAMSKNCALEFRFAHVSLKLPIVKAIVGKGNDWRKNEIGFLAGNYPEINFQQENPDGLKELVKLVKNELETRRANQATKNEPKTSKMKDIEQAADNVNSAYHELYELTQRKFLKQLAKYSSRMQLNVELPRLFCIDYVSESKVKLLTKILERTSKNHSRKQNARKWSIAERVNPTIIADPETSTREVKEEFVPCIRVMCEHENEWHVSNLLSVLPEPVSTEYASYLARVMRIIKNGNLASEIQVLTSESGAKLMADLEAKAIAESGGGESKLEESYSALRKFYYDCYENKKVLCESGDVSAELKRCELKNGRVVWLCEKHILETNARILNDANKTTAKTEVDLNSEMIHDIDQIDIQI